MVLSGMLARHFVLVALLTSPLLASTGLSTTPASLRIQAEDRPLDTGFCSSGTWPWEWGRASNWEGAEGKAILYLQRAHCWSTWLVDVPFEVRGVTLRSRGFGSCATWMVEVDGAEFGDHRVPCTTWNQWGSSKLDGFIPAGLHVVRIANPFVAEADQLLDWFEFEPIRHERQTILGPLVVPVDGTTPDPGPFAAVVATIRGRNHAGSYCVVVEPSNGPPVEVACAATFNAPVPDVGPVPVVAHPGEIPDGADAELQLFVTSSHDADRLVPLARALDGRITLYAPFAPQDAGWFAANAMHLSVRIESALRVEGVPGPVTATLTVPGLGQVLAAADASGA